jgi:cell division protein FtsB
MAKQVINGFLTAYHWQFQEPGEVSWAFNSWAPAADADMLHHFAFALEFDAPDINVVAAQVASLEAQKLAALAEYQKTVAQLNERLSKLQAIECNTEAA